jgi:hypothetical protein
MRLVRRSEPRVQASIPIRPQAANRDSCAYDRIAFHIDELSTNRLLGAQPQSGLLLGQHLVKFCQRRAIGTFDQLPKLFVGMQFGSAATRCFEGEGMAPRHTVAVSNRKYT